MYDDVNIAILHIFSCIICIIFDTNYTILVIDYTPSTSTATSMTYEYLTKMIISAIYIIF